MYDHYHSHVGHSNNSVVTGNTSAPKTDNLHKVPSKEDWRYENVLRMNKGMSALSYEEFVRQVRAGLIKA